MLGPTIGFHHYHSKDHTVSEDIINSAFKASTHRDSEIANVFVRPLFPYTVMA